MNIETLVSKLKTLIETTSGCVEHSPRTSDDRKEPLPNTNLYRLVIAGTGKDKTAGCSRYADFLGVVVRPLSGGDANKSNLDAAIDTETLITALADFAESDTVISEEIESELTRELGRMVSTLSFRVAYKLT